MTVPMLSLWRGLVAPPPLTLKSICADIAERYGVTVEELRGPSRLRGIVHARHEAMLLARRFTRQSTTSIGRYFNRDHTTVINGARRAAERLEALAT